jgi:hypothetical protein
LTCPSEAEFDLDEELDQVSWGSDFDDDDDEDDEFGTCYLDRALDGRLSSLSSDRLSRCGAYDLHTRFALANLTLGKFHRVPSPGSSETNVTAQTAPIDPTAASVSASGSEFASGSCSPASSEAPSSSGHSAAAAIESCGSSTSCESSACASNSRDCTCCSDNGKSHRNSFPRPELSDRLKQQLNEQLKRALSQQHLRTVSAGESTYVKEARGDSLMTTSIDNGGEAIGKHIRPAVQSTFRPGHSPVLGLASLQCRNNNNCTAAGCDRKCQLTSARPLIVNEYDCVACEPLFKPFAELPSPASLANESIETEAMFRNCISTVNRLSASSAHSSNSSDKSSISEGINSNLFFF